MKKYIIEFSGKQDFTRALLYNLKELITCKNCEHFEGIGHYCQLDRFVPTANDFCSCAEYKEEKNNGKR